MDSLIAYVVVALIVLLLVVAGVFLLRRGKSARPDRPRVDVQPTQTAGEASPTSTTIADPDVAVVEPDAPPVVVEPEVERPEAVGGRMARLRARLAGSNALGRGLLALLSRGSLDEATWDEVEEILLTSDLGVGPTNEVMDQLRTQLKVEGASDANRVREVLRVVLLEQVNPGMDRRVATARNAAADVPAVVMMVGVNGTGKTTTTGKLARLLVAEDEDVLMGAADTFRAAAAEQLTTWGERVGVPVVRKDEGADPASVAFDAVSAGIDAEVDCVLIDTAGRLHTKVGLMDELGKVKRVIEKLAPVTEVLLVLDATTGQNGLLQARTFAEVVDITGVVLTKLDGTAKGGIVVSVQRELNVPVKLVGLGEGPDDLAPFDPEQFVDALLTT